MRYMHKKIYFNKLELKELERRNPTLFEVAQHVANKAHITAKVQGNNWITVAEGDGSDYSKLLCPPELFHVPGANFSDGDPKCDDLRCWSTHEEPSANPDKPYRPCWFRHWNDFVSDMKYDYMEY